MMESIKLGCADHTWAILLMLLGAFLLGLLLGYLLWYAYKKLVAGLEAEKAQMSAKLVDWEKDYASLKYKYGELEKDYSGVKVSLNNCEADKVILQNKLNACMAEKADLKAAAETAGAAGFVVGAGKATSKDTGGPTLLYAGLFNQNNLQIVEGIGPKVEKVLHDAGIGSWAALAAKKPEELRKILDDAGSRFRIIDPKSWPKQAELATGGKWDELIEYQKFLDAGREDVGDFETDSKFEKMALKLMGSKSTPNDLKIVEGIGPKIEQLLKDAGIKTWMDLSNAPLEKIQKVLDDAGPRYRIHDPSTWAKQAGLAASGKWKELEKYQDFLQGGREG